MDERTADLAVVLTLGNSYDSILGELVPTVAGKLSCELAVRIWKDGHCRAIAVLGGDRLYEESESVVYSQYIRTLDPSIEIEIINASQVCTARDIGSPSALRSIDQYFQSIKSVREDALVFVIASHDHAKRAIYTFERHGFRRLEIKDSGAKHSGLGYKLLSPLLTLITFMDPDWQGLFGRFLADRTEWRRSERLKPK